MSEFNWYINNLQVPNLINKKYLTSSQIKSACFWDQAIYKGNWNKQQRTWIVDEKANQEYIQQLRQD